jgi:hypothetical protein
LTTRSLGRRASSDGEVVELHQYRDQRRVWFLLVLDARVSRHRMLTRLHLAEHLIDEPDLALGAWRRSSTGGDWRGCRL